jgi:thiamine biosynthesis protein ThiS
MKITINGESRAVSAETLSVLVEQLGMRADRVAVELNRDIVPRDRWTETRLHDGDTLEIVHFVGGGSAWSQFGSGHSRSGTGRIIFERIS